MVEKKWGICGYFCLSWVLIYLVLRTYSLRLHSHISTTIETKIVPCWRTIDTKMVRCLRTTDIKIALCLRTIDRHQDSTVFANY